MARLCVRILANDHPTDPALTPMRTNLGDVVCIQDDGHVFSHAELNNGHYRIVDLPGVAPDDLSNLVRSADDVNGVMTARRAFKLNAAALKAGIWIGKTSATKAQIDLITVARV